MKNVKLSPMTAGYLAIYIKLSDLCGEAAEVTEMDYGGSAVNEVNSEFDSALGKAQDEVMKLAVRQQNSADGQAIALRRLQHALGRIAGIDDGADAVVIRSEIAIGLVAAQHQGIDLHGILLFSHRTNA